MATIQSIVYMPRNEEDYDRFGPYLRLPIEEARLRANYGLEGDHKAGRDKKRQLNIIPTDWLATRAAWPVRSTGRSTTVTGVPVPAVPAEAEKSLVSHAPA